MAYSEKNCSKIEYEFSFLQSRYGKLLLSIIDTSSKLKQERAKEYLTYGIGRRLTIIYRCIRNIFSIFPPNKKDLLSDDELSNVCINLHAHYVNMLGLLDNIAWVVIYEKCLSNSIKKTNVDLYKRETQQHLKKEFCDYLNSKTIKNWYDSYSKDYRDALSHRIPLFVPPYQQNMETKEISPADWFIHSFEEKTPPHRMHPQLLNDFITIKEILEKFSALELGFHTN